MGWGEIALIAVLILVFVGPDELPKLLRFLGRNYGKLRRASDDLRRTFTLEVDKVDAEARAAEIDARAYIKDANEALEPIGVEIPEHEDYDTVGGYVLSVMGHIPQKGETFFEEGRVVHILEAEPTRVVAQELHALLVVRLGSVVRIGSNWSAGIRVLPLHHNETHQHTDDQENRDQERNGRVNSAAGLAARFDWHIPIGDRGKIHRMMIRKGSSPSIVGPH